MKSLEKKYAVPCPIPFYARSVNVVFKEMLLEEDISSLFCDAKEEAGRGLPISEWFYFENDIGMRFDKLMRDIRVFPTAAQAKGEGFYGPIPKGFSAYLIGKSHRAVYFCMWNPSTKELNELIR